MKTNEIVQQVESDLKIGDKVKCTKTVYFINGDVHHKNEEFVVYEDCLSYFLFCLNKDYIKV